MRGRTTSSVQGTIVNPDQQRRASIRRRRAEIIAWLCLVLLVVAGAPTYIGVVHAERLEQLGPNALTGVPALGYIIDLRVTTSDAPDPVQTGQDVQYDINLDNLGPNVASGVGVDVFYSSALTPVAQATPGWSCSLGGVISCSPTVPNLNVGAAAPLLRLRFTAPATPQTVQINVTASANEPDSNPSNNTNVTQSTQVVFGTANLTLGITPSTSGATVGTPISFTANVANAGPGDAPSLQVNGSLSGAISFSSFSVSSAWNCSHSNGTIGCIYQGGSPTGTLANGVNAAPIIINGIAGPGAGSAQISLNATSAVTDPSPASASSSIAVSAPPPPAVDLSLSKTVIGAQPIPRDSVFSYRLQVSNSSSSNQTASEVRIDDVLPAGIQLQGFSGAGWSCTGAVVCNYLPTLAIGQSSAPLDLQVVYSNPVPANGAVVSNTASVSAAEPDPNPSNNQSTAIANFRGRADLGVQLTGPSSVVAGSPFNVELVASNSGPDVASGVTAVATVAAGFSVSVVTGGAGWSCLASGQSVSCQRPSMPTGNSVAAGLTLIAPAAAGGPFQQVATISGNSFDPSSSNNSSLLQVSVTPGSTTLFLTKTDSADPVAVASEFDYTLIVTNGGAIAQTGVAISDPLPSGISYVGFSGTGWVCNPGPAASSNVIDCQRPGTLAAGASSSVRLRVRADAAGIVTNTAQVRSEQNSTGASASQATTLIGSAALTLAKRARSASVIVGELATFDLTVGNTGQGDASDIVLVDTLPTGLAAVSASGDGWTCTVQSASVDCRRPTLLRSSTSVVVIEARPSSVGTLVNSAQVQASGGAPVQASDTITATAATAAGADLVLDLSDSADPVAQGAEFDYLLRVRNAGPDPATGVRTASVLPAAVQLVGTGSAGWNCQPGQSVVCTLGGALAVGAESVLVMRVRATGSGLATHTASVAANEADPNPGNSSDTETTEIQAQATLADLQLSASGPASAVAGGSVELQAQIRNLGPAPASMLLLRAQAGGPWTLQGGSGSGFTCVAAGVNLECRGNALAAGQTVELRLQGTVNATASSALSALLDVSAATADPVAGNNSANVTVPLGTAPPQSADLAISKADSVDPVAFGERFSYTLTARNLGPGVASNVVIRDLLPASLVFVSASGAGTTCSGGAAVECRASAPLAVGQQLQVVVTVDAPTERESISNEATVESSTTDPVAGNNRAVETTQVVPPEGSQAEEELESATLGDAIAGDAVAPVVGLCDGAAGQVSALCDALFADAATGNDAEVNQALRSLYPEEVLSHHASLNQLSATQFFNVDARMSELRGGGGGFSVAGLTLINGSQAIPLGLFQSLLDDQEPEIGGPGELISPWGFFVNGTISRGDQEIKSDQREVVTDFDSIGITAGVDYRFSSKWVLGAALGYNQFESDLTDDGSLDTSGFTLTAYSAYYVTDQTYFDTRLSYGQVDLDQTRRLIANLTGFTLDETLKSDTSATQLSIAGSFGHHFTRGAWTITPNAFVRYMTSDVDGFAERGSEFGVRYDDQTVKGTVFGVGVQINRVFSLSNGVLVPQFDVVWNQETGNDDTVIEASYVGGEPGEFFRLSPEDPDESYGSFGFGLVYVLANGKQAYLQWRESIGVDGLDRSTVNIGARFEF
jgi:uncharacterized repeat protein (TIGR01451 family)